MVPIWAGTLGITDEEKQSFESHLTVCQACIKEYEETKRLMSLVKKHWVSVSTETRQLLEQAGYEVLEQKHVSNNHSRPMTVEEGWQDLCKRCSDLAETTEKSKSLQLFLRIGAVAACLIIGILTWMEFSNYSKTQNLPQDFSSQQVATAPKPSVKVELVRPSGNTAVATNQKIVADNELKILLINRKHRMVMNVGTSLCIEPFTANAQIGCLVKLAAGEFYTHIQHDGNQFIVNTAHGQAVITGTTFDIKVTEDSTTLVVIEGIVRFESEKGTVNVEASQKSKIIGQSAPSIPLSCNTAELTAWATAYKPNTALAQAESDDDWYLTFSLRRDPIVLAETDYKQWIEEKRDWFKKDFPWIFELKDALNKEAINIDYPELLIESGDIWQFVCLQKFPARFSVPDFESLLKTTVSYGFSREWLLKNVPIAGIIQGKSFHSQNLTGLAAFEQLLKYTKGMEPTPYYLYPAHACKYLVETKSLIWFAINAGKFNLTDNQRVVILDLLQQEVTAASNCSNDLWYPADEQKKPFCNEDSRETAGTKIIGHIETIKMVEEEVVKPRLNKQVNIKDFIVNKS